MMMESHNDLTWKWTETGRTEGKIREKSLKFYSVRDKWVKARSHLHSEPPLWTASRLSLNPRAVPGKSRNWGQDTNWAAQNGTNPSWQIQHSLCPSWIHRQREGVALDLGTGRASKIPAPLVWQETRVTAPLSSGCDNHTFPVPFLSRLAVKSFIYS